MIRTISAWTEEDQAPNACMVRVECRCDYCLVRMPMPSEPLGDILADPGHHACCVCIRRYCRNVVREDTCLQPQPMRRW